MKNCLYCQQSFEPINGKQKYCSDDCKRKRKNESRRKKEPNPMIQCENCGMLFEKKAHNSRHCSEECRCRKETERKLLRRLKKLHPARICTVCGTEFFKDPKKFDFCSSKCREKDRVTKLYEKEVSVHAPNYKRQSTHEREYQANPIRYKLQKRAEYANRKASQLGIEGRLRAKDLREFFDRVGWKCAYCGKKLNHLDISIDHKIALSKGGKNEISNINPSCMTCNKRKHTKTPQEFLSTFD